MLYQSKVNEVPLARLRGSLGHFQMILSVGMLEFYEYKSGLGEGKCRFQSSDMASVYAELLCTVWAMVRPFWGKILMLVLHLPLETSFDLSMHHNHTDFFLYPL